ncbi:hypothetical protein C8A03DRAFT_36423, partial [Achaetomium macrosporum]
MDPQPDRDPPFSDASTHVLPGHPAGFELALEAECKARLEEIEWQRDEESAAMRNRLYSLVMEYKRRDQSFVDRYTECLEQLTRRLPAVANTRPWAKPCRGVAEWETFYRGGIAIRFYPSTGNSLLVPHGDNAEGETVTPRKFPSNITTTNAEYPPCEFSPSSSPLSSVPCSPEPVSRLAPDTREARPRKQLKRPLSPDELAFGSSSSPPGVNATMLCEYDSFCQPLRPLQNIFASLAQVPYNSLNMPYNFLHQWLSHTFNPAAEVEDACHAADEIPCR